MATLGSMQPVATKPKNDGAVISDELLTIKGFTALQKLTKKTFYGLANAGELPAPQDPREMAHQAGRAGPVGRRAAEGTSG